MFHIPLLCNLFRGQTKAVISSCKKSLKISKRAIIHCVDTLATQEAMYYDLALSIPKLFDKEAEVVKKFCKELKEEKLEKVLAKNPLEEEEKMGRNSFENAESLSELYELLRCPKK